MWSLRSFELLPEEADEQRTQFALELNAESELFDILGLDVEFWHDTGAYSPYGIVLPIITATQLPGPYRHRHYRVTFTSLYTNTVTCTPYRGAGRPQGCFVMERTMDRIAEHLGLDRAEVLGRRWMPFASLAMKPFTPAPWI